MNKLPDKCGDLIRLAVKDLTLCEANPDYTVDMGKWHQYDDDEDTCYVCLAGSVMAQSLSVEKYKGVAPAGFEDEIRSKLNFLDLCRYLRRGNQVHAAFRLIPSIKNYEALIESGEAQPVTPYRKEPGQFKTDMLALADLMDKYNVHYIGD